jgi:hypothetical protein
MYWRYILPFSFIPVDLVDMFLTTVCLSSIVERIPSESNKQPTTSRLLALPSTKRDAHKYGVVAGKKGTGRGSVK